MPTVTHPRALDGVDGTTPAQVSLGREHYDVADDGSVTVPDESHVRTLARAHGVAADELREADTCDVVKSDGEVCGRDRPCPYHDSEA